MDDLLFAEDGASVQATEKVDVDLSPAFMNIEQGQLLLGNFYYPNDYETPENHHITTPDGTENPAVMYAFAADPCRAGPFRSPCPTTCSPFPAWSRAPVSTDDGRIVLSVSYGIAPSHLLAYNVNLAAPDGTFTTGLRRRGGAVLPRFPQPDGRPRRAAAHAGGHRIP